MSEECKSESGCAASIEPVSEEEKKEEIQTEMTMEEPKEEEFPEAAEIASVLGALTATCSIVPDEAKESCWSAITPLENGNESPKEAVRAILEKGEGESLERSLKALEKIVADAKQELIDEGKITK